MGCAQSSSQTAVEQTAEPEPEQPPVERSLSAQEMQELFEEQQRKAELRRLESDSSQSL
jgi:hypothetical protein